MLIIRIITFKVAQPLSPQITNVTDGQKDGQHTMAISRFALRASRGKRFGDMFSHFDMHVVHESQTERRKDKLSDRIGIAYIQLAQYHAVKTDGLLIAKKIYTCMCEV